LHKKQALIKICSNAQTLVDLYLNYDCDVNGEDIFETTVKEVSRILTQSWGATDQTSLAEVVETNLKRRVDILVYGRSARFVYVACRP